MTNERLEFDLLQPLLELLAESGIRRSEVFALPELQALQGIAQEDISETKVTRLLQASASLARDPALALRLGQRIQISSLGTFGFALMSCADLREVLRLIIRYHPLFSVSPTWAIYQQGEQTVLRTQLPLNQAGDQILMMELISSIVVSLGNFLLNRALHGAEIHCNYPAPKHWEIYDDFFSMPVKFNQPHCQLLISEQLLLTPVQTANPAGQVVFQQQCEDMLRSLNRVNDVTAAVRRLLIRAGGKFPDIHQVAERMSVSERTLRRKLRAESTSFRKICDEVRNLLACQYLSTTQFTVAEIGELLNYSETVSFRRAFVRWNGVTPVGYRRRVTE